MKVVLRNGEIREGSFEEKEVKEAFWHTSAHVLAQAVKRLYPETKCAIGPDGEKHRPIMIHRVVFGSIERFMGILIEHYAGKFPVWLSPVQVKILPVSDKYLAYAREVAESLKVHNIRIEIDDRDEKLGFKIREARLDKVPYMLILGEKEQEAGTVSVRQRDAEADKQDMGQMEIEEFVNILEL